ncbi:MAG: FKBP-type peptidyl-prolyl cis-trans isomerase [Ferruginibacter sp.]
MMHIEKDSVVSIRYIMKNSKEEVLENTMNNQPVSYLHGSATILPLLQDQLEGMKAGDKKVLYLPAATGLTNEDFIFEVIVDEVRVALKEEVLLGYPLSANVPACDADCECYPSP